MYFKIVYGRNQKHFNFLQMTINLVVEEVEEDSVVQVGLDVVVLVEVVENLVKEEEEVEILVMEEAETNQEKVVVVREEENLEVKEKEVKPISGYYYFL